MNGGTVPLRYFPSMWRIKDWSNIQQITSTKKPNIDKNIMMETLSEEFKPLGLENYEFQNRQNKKMNWTFSHVQPINIPI